MPKIVDREEVRGQILSAAMSVFAARGYQATTISDIAAEAGMGKGTIYLYFRSKEEMTATMVDRHFEALEARFRNETAPDTLEALLALVRRSLDVPPGEARFVRVFFEVFGPSFASPDFSARIEAVFDRIGAQFADHLVRLQQDGEIGPSHDTGSLGRSLAAMIDGLVLHRGLFSISSRRYRAMIDSTLRLFSDGLRR